MFQFTYKEYSQWNDKQRAKRGAKPTNKIIKFIYFALCLILVNMFLFFLIAIAKSIKNNSKPYRTSNNYKKVIKEGVFFDTVEYHER